MLRSLFSGISGLKVHQQKMDVIGNNIANVNTYGFKASRVTFKDVFYQTVTGSADPTELKGGGNASQVGYGATLGSIDVLHGRAGYAPTGRTMDVAIEGDGMLVAQDSAGNRMYTRVGNLNFDADGYLVDANRNYICGYPVKLDANGKPEFEKNVPVAGTGVGGANATQGGLTVSTGTENGSLLNDYNIKVSNGAAPGSIKIDGKTITIEAPDLATANKFFTDAAALTSEPATPAGKALWKLKNTVPKGTDLSKVAISLTPAKAPVGIGTFPAAGEKPYVMTVAGGVSEETGRPVLDTSNGPQRIKIPNTLVDSDDNGYFDTAGAGLAPLESIAIGSDGVITGTQDSKIVPVGQICIASVPNPEAMVMQGNSYYKAVNNTGEIKIEAAGLGSGGSIVSGNLESSNVDLSTEFSDMITTQRGFQANSRIITVGDQMLEELVNLKR